MKAAVIVRIITAQAARHRAMGAITDATFEEQMRRLEREELEPKGMCLLVRELPGGRTRFIVKDKATGLVCEMMEYAGGNLETEAEVPDSDAVIGKS